MSLFCDIYFSVIAETAFSNVNIIWHVTVVPYEKMFLLRQYSVIYNSKMQRNINPVTCDTAEHSNKQNKQTNSVALVHKRTIPTERQPLVGEVSAKFCR
jgi:hypothetical protein